MLENPSHKTHSDIWRCIFPKYDHLFFSIPSAYLSWTCVHLHFQYIIKNACDTHTQAPLLCSPLAHKMHPLWRNLVICTVHVLIAFPIHHFLCTNQDARALLHKVKSGQLLLEGICVSIDEDMVFFTDPPTLAEPTITPVLSDAVWGGKRKKIISVYPSLLH